MAGERVQRRLAATLAADVADYSRIPMACKNHYAQFSGRAVRCPLSTDSRPLSLRKPTFESRR